MPAATQKKPPKTAASTEPQDIRRPPATAEDGPEPLLRINTIAPTRPTMEIDDEVYEFSLPKDFGIVVQQELDRDGREFNRLWNKDTELNSNERKRLKMLLERMFTRIGERIPTDVRSRLDDYDKAQAILIFTMAPLIAAAQQENQDNPQPTEDPSTSES